MKCLRINPVTLQAWLQSAYSCPSQRHCSVGSRDSSPTPPFCFPLGTLWQVNYLSPDPSRWIVIRLCLYKNIPSLDNPSQSDHFEVYGIRKCDVLLSLFSGMGSGRGKEVPQVFINTLKPPPPFSCYHLLATKRFPQISCHLLSSTR